MDVSKSAPLVLARRMMKGSDIADRVNDAGKKDRTITANECDSFAAANPSRATDANLLKEHVSIYADAGPIGKAQIWAIALLG
ncbi:MAG: hypothetical protein ACT4TC_04420 [Myxococcaceae bacterium]